MKPRRAIAVLGAGLAVLVAGCSDERKICRRMGELCGTEAAECRAAVDELRSSLGDEGLDELAQCYADADSCAEAKGCEAALAMKGAASAMGDFIESFGEKLGESEKED